MFPANVLIREHREDAVIEAVFLPAFPAIALAEMHIVDIELAKPLLGLSEQLRNPLDGINLLDQWREDGILVAKRQARALSARHIGASMTSGGIGKKDDSAKLKMPR